MSREGIGLQGQKGQEMTLKCLEDMADDCPRRLEEEKIKGGKTKFLEEQDLQILSKNTQENKEYQVQLML